jgi:hypothetical protein
MMSFAALCFFSNEPSVDRPTPGHSIHVGVNETAFSLGPLPLLHRALLSLTLFFPTQQRRQKKVHCNQKEQRQGCILFIVNNQPQSNSK